MRSSLLQTQTSWSSPKSIRFQHLFWFIVLSVIWLGTLGWRDLIPSDEGRYAEIAREMLVSGNWLVPRYNGYLYFEKPPLQLWATAAAFKIFGLGEWQARLWSGLCSLFGIALVWYTTSRLWGERAGILAGMILASTPIWVIGGHFNSLDMGVAFFMSGALCCLLLGLHAPSKSRTELIWLLLCWSMMALSVLSKGLIGIVVPGLVLVMYSLFTWDWSSWRRMHWLSGLFLFFAITLPWFVLIIEQHPSFYQFFFIHEHFERFTTNEHQRTASWYFFLPLLAVGFLPWLLNVAQAVQLAFQEQRHHALTFKPLCLCLVWIVTITAFFSISQSKLPGYIFPVIPPLAILVGVSIQHLFDKKLSPQLRSVNVWLWQILVLAGLFCIGFFFLPNIRNTGEVYEKLHYAHYTRIVSVALSIGLLGCVLAWYLRRKPLASLLTYASTIIIVALTAGLGHEAVGGLLSGKALAQQTKALIHEADPLYGVGMLDHTVPFYLEHPLIMVQFQDELAFGISQEPQRWIAHEDDWVNLWKESPHTRAFAMMTPKKYSELFEQGLPMEIIAQDPIRIVIGKPGLNH